MSRKHTLLSRSGRTVAAGCVLATMTLTWCALAAEPTATTCTFSGGTASVELGPNAGRFAFASLYFKAAGLKVVDTNTPVPCSGGPITLENTDAIRVTDPIDGHGSYLIYGRRGSGAASYAPGLSDEGDDSSEIETSIELGGDSGDTLDLYAERARRGQDRVVASQGGGEIRFNLNADLETRTLADVDLTVSGIGGSRRLRHHYPDGVLLLNLGAGRDFFDGRGRGLPGGKVRQSMVIRGGADRGGLTVKGGSGDDMIYGADARDKIKPGKGSDLVDAQPGNDRINVADGARDVVKCGAGKDTVVADRRRDKLINCEKVQLR